MNQIDDEDWLYRRGQYGGDPGSEPAADPDATRVRTPPAAAPVPPSADAVELGRPTPVGHHGERPAAQPTSAPASAPSRTPQAQPGGAASGQRPPVKRKGRRIGRTLVWVLVVGLIYLLGVPLATWPFMPRVDAAPAGQRPAEQPGSLYLLAGSDSRAGLTPEEQQRLGTGSDAGQRTDTIMLLYLPVQGRAALVSVPRDSFLAIPGHGKNKINAAYALGGPTLLVQTVEQNTGLRVDGYAEVGFGGFVNVVDAVGGIELCPASAIKDRDSNLDIPAGCQQMDGVTALGYVRMRKADPLGDLGRAQRQREMLGALAKKVISPATILLPWRWWGVNHSASRAITLGADDGVAELTGIGTAVVRLGTGQGVTLSVPIGNADATTSAGSSVLWDDKQSKAMFAAMAKGEAIDSWVAPR